VHSDIFAYLPVMHIGLRHEENGLLFATAGGHVKSIEAHPIARFSGLGCRACARRPPLL
jgi:hypothetical protein